MRLRRTAASGVYLPNDVNPLHRLLTGDQAQIEGDYDCEGRGRLPSEPGLLDRPSLRCAMRSLPIMQRRDQS